LVPDLARFLAQPRSRVARLSGRLARARWHIAGTATDPNGNVLTTFLPPKLTQ
jgi:hypothetical protein